MKGKLAIGLLALVLTIAVCGCVSGCDIIDLEKTCQQHGFIKYTYGNFFVNETEYIECWGILDNGSIQDVSKYIECKRR